MYGLMSEIGRRHDVAVLAYKPAGVDVQREVQATGEYATLVVTVGNPHLGVSNSRKRARQLRSLASPGSYERLTYGLPQMQRTLDRLCCEWRPDVIVVEFAQMGYFQFPEGIPVVLDAHNVEHEIITRLAGLEPSIARQVYSRVNAAKLRREETALMASVDGVAVTSERDAQILQGLIPERRFDVVPNGVDSRAFTPGHDEGQAAKLLFYGALDYFPNQDAVSHFASEIWPMIRRDHPEAKFEVVGRRAPAEFGALAKEAGFMITGFVEDIRGSVAAASVVVVPLRAGSGTRLKVLEAMAMAKPVVSTSLGVEGLEVVDGQHVLLADDPRQFANAVSRLLRSPEERRRIGTAARQLAVERYDWREIAFSFEQVIEATVQRRQR